MIVVVDSDGLIGVSNAQDTHYLASLSLIQRLNQKKVKYLYPATTIAEATAILQIRLNKPDTANQIIESVKLGLFHIEPVDREILVSATTFLKGSASKHTTLFDAIVAAMAQKYHADAIFSFDKFYKKIGFKLAGDL